MAALKRRLDESGGAPGPFAVATLLDLVALGTVADVVPLDANNRVLVAQGLKRIRAGRCVAGIRALLQLSGRSSRELTAADLAFGVAPRLNAAGRIDDMSIGIQCLLDDDETRAAGAGRAPGCSSIRSAAASRRRCSRRRSRRCGCSATRPPARSSAAASCCFDESWHQGVVGLVASRVKERLRRPVIAFALADAATLRGSARSIPGVHIRDVLDAIAAAPPGAHQPLRRPRHGGGADARARAARALRARLRRRRSRRWMAAWVPTDAIETDGELTVTEIALETAQALRAGGPGARPSRSRASTASSASATPA